MKQTIFAVILVFASSIAVFSQAEKKDVKAQETKAKKNEKNLLVISNTAKLKEITIFPQKLLDAEITGIAGKNFRISDSKAKIRMVVFFSSWLGPFRPTMKKFAELKNYFAQKNVEIIALTTDSGELEQKAIIKQIEAYKVGFFKVGFATEEFIKELEIKGIPQFWILSTDGKILNKKLGYTPKVHDVLIKTIEENFEK